jgi:hypothetical protein
MKPHETATIVLLGRYLMMLALGCFIVVVLTHVCEAYDLFPSMGWGLKDSAGHYLDLSAAVLGLALFPVGCFLWALESETLRNLIAPSSKRRSLRWRKSRKSWSGTVNQSHST